MPRAAAPAPARARAPPPRRPRCRPASPGRRALDHAVRDPEEAHLEVLVRLEGDVGLRQEYVTLAPRVLSQVLLELLDQRRLVALELRAVAGREVDDVLVRRVDLRDGDHLVVVHLLRELPRQLDRLHVAAERASEGAFEKRLDLLLDSPKHGDPPAPESTEPLSRRRPGNRARFRQPPGAD